MAGTKHQRLRVGVIGLGRLWETRHKPSLARLEDRFRVTAVYDTVYRRAELEAAQIGCAACEGLSALVERTDVDVIYLLSRQWFGLHPITLACAARKPVYCALPLADDLIELESLAELVEQSGIVFMPEFARRCYPATLRLKELLATHLGPPRLIVGHTRLYGFDRYAVPGPTTQIAPAPLLIDPGSYLLDWCCFVFQTLPDSLHGMQCQVITAPDRSDPEPDFESFTATFPGGATAQISFGRYHRGAWGDASRFLPQPGFQVFAERGAAWLEMPEKILWSNAAGSKEERLALEPTVGDVLNDQFHRVVRGDHSLAPTIRDALEIARQVSVLRQSSQDAEGFPIMGMDPKHPTAHHPSQLPPASSVWICLTALAALVGLALIVDASLASSATYDEVAYLRVAAQWWRTGDQSEITRMGSPLTFWKLQQVPVLWLLDHLGQSDLDRRPDEPSATALAARAPRVRLDLAPGLCHHDFLEPSQLRSPGDGARGLALCAEPQSPGPWCSGNDGTSFGRRHHGHVLAVLAVPRDKPPALVLGLGRSGWSGVFV